MSHNTHLPSTVSQKTATSQGQASVAIKPQTMFKAMADKSGLRHGQVVIVTARWVLVLAGLLLTVWNASAVNELRIQIGVVLLLALANFYLQAQLLMKRPMIDLVVYGASAFDFLVITTLIMTQGYFHSELYIFYFPAILALSVAFPTFVTVTFTGSIMFIYSLISLNGLFSAADNGQVLLIRLFMLGGVAFCGNLYWRLERARHRAVLEAKHDLLTQIRQHQSTPPVS